LKAIFSGGKKLFQKLKFWNSLMSDILFRKDAAPHFNHGNGGCLDAQPFREFALAQTKGLAERYQPVPFRHSDSNLIIIKKSTEEYKNISFDGISY
jgi:hypothetical protein